MKYALRRAERRGAGHYKSCLSKTGGKELTFPPVFGADWGTLYELREKEEADREHSPTCLSISSTYDFEKRSVENLSWKLYVMTI